MTKYFSHKLVYLLLVFLILPVQISFAADDFKVVVSIKPVYSIMAGLMKDIAEPVLLINEDKTPFNFTVEERHRRLLRDAKLVIWTGAELEKSLQEMIVQLPAETEVVELLASDRLKILPDRNDYELRDPFFWLDDRNMLILLDMLVEKLVELDPMRSHIYSRNHREMLKPLLKIDREYEYGYRGMKAGLGVQYYDVLQYFEQAYALHNLGALATTPHQPVDAKKLLNVGGVIKNREAACLFVDKSMPADHLDLLVSGQVINIGELDVFGMQFNPGPELYLELMQHNTDVIKGCLNADMDAASQARQAAASEDFPASGVIGGRFILTNHLGQTFTEQDMKGHYALIFFGYTSCPDICPTSLMVLTQAFKLLDDDIKEQVVPYFISVDPERDSIEVLKDYVSYFTPKLVGLTGSQQMIKRVAGQFKAKYEKVEISSSKAGLYNMDHTSSLFFMAPDGRFITKFANGITPDELAKQLQLIIH